MKTYTIRTFDELLIFIESTENLSMNQLNEILMQSINCIMIYEHNKIETIQILKVFREKWGKQKERPIFIDIGSLNVF